MSDRAGPRAFLVAAVACGAWCSVACGSEPAPRAASRPSLLDSPGATALAYPTPARWRYHPRDAAQLLAKNRIGGEQTLLAGKRGERWLVDARRGHADVAAELAPEDLVAIVSKPDGGWLFLGKGGTSYEARDPLGAFVRSSAPLDPLVRVRAAEGILLGVRRDGALLRSDTAGAAWARVGPELQRFQDVALGPAGRGLALAVPEALWETRDAGSTWRPLATAAPTIGAETLVLDEAGAVVVATPLGLRRWDPDAALPLVPSARLAAAQALSLGVPLPIGPSAFALADGRAVALGEQWIELRSAAEAGAWQIVSGAFGERLTAAPFAKARGCAQVRLAGYRSTLYLACARQKSETITQPLEISRSTDSGRSWTVEPYAADGRLAELSLAVGADGELLVSGVCPEATRGAGCMPVGVHRRRRSASDAGPPIVLAPSATPSLAGSVLSLGMSLDGTTAYAIGRRSKSDALAVFVSKDGGGTFDARDVEPLTAADEDDSRARGRSAEALVESFAASEDGTVAFVVARRGRRVWLVVDDEGRAVSLARPPIETARIGAAGQRAFAMDPASREAWESLDGGATWAALGRLAVDPCPGVADCAAPIACVARGCALADTVSRIGWSEPARSAVLPPPFVEARSRRWEPRVGAPFSCSLEPGEWRRIVGALGTPSADQAAIGKAAWFVTRHDPGVASVSTLHARIGKSLTLEEVPLLLPSRHAEDMAYAASVQIEGLVALRFALPATGDATLRNVEVAWDDVLSSHVGHAVIPDGGPYRPGDYGDGKSRAKFANPPLVSIASGGVYVRLHSALDDAQPTYFVDGHSVEVVPPVVWPEEVRRRGSSEMVRVGRTHVPVRLDGPMVVRATLEHGRPHFDAGTFGWAQPKEFGRAQSVDIAYLGDRAGLHLVSADLSGREAEGQILPFRADGAVLDAPVRVPTQLDLPSSPRPCTLADRASTPRVVVPFQPGTRHPVIVTDPTEPLRVLLTDQAVLHGQPASPCVAAFDAVLVSMDETKPPQPETAILPFDALERSALFRMPAVPSGGAPVLEWRAMTCRVEPTAEVPAEVFREKGALVEPR